METNQIILKCLNNSSLHQIAIIDFKNPTGYMITQKESGFGKKSLNFVSAILQLSYNSSSFPSLSMFLQL